MQLPEGYEARTAPRSSTFKRWGILQANSVGVIDNSYCGTNDEWKLPVYATRDTVLEKGDRICQFRIYEVQPPISFEECDTLSDTDRGLRLDRRALIFENDTPIQERMIWL